MTAAASAADSAASHSRTSFKNVSECAGPARRESLPTLMRVRELDSGRSEPRAVCCCCTPSTYSVAVPPARATTSTTACHCPSAMARTDASCTALVPSARVANTRLSRPRKRAHPAATALLVSLSAISTGVELHALTRTETPTLKSRPPTFVADVLAITTLSLAPERARADVVMRVLGPSEGSAVAIATPRSGSTGWSEGRGAAAVVDGDGDGDTPTPPQLYSTDVDVDELPDPPVSKRVVRRSTPDVDTPPPGTFSRPVSVVPPVPDDAASHRRGNTVVSRYLNCAPDATCAPFSVTLYDPGVVPMQQMPSP